jgi:SepF-like predicted cell division protein (DUF552 family)
MAFNIKKFFGKEANEEDYVEIDLDSLEPKENKVKVKPFVLRHFDDTNEILNSLREGYTITIVDIKPLKAKDIIELKRSIAKIKKTTEALNGSIAGFGDNTIIVTPAFAEIHRETQPSLKKDKADFLYD